MASATLRLGDLRLEGESRAGSETWFRVFPPGLAFDAGRGAPQLSGARDLFLSHGHLDHALGTPYLLSQRSMHRDQETRVFCPAATAEPLEALIAAAGRLENTTYDYELRGLTPGERVNVGRGLVVEAFATDHVVASLGYHLLRRRTRLKAEFRQLVEERGENGGIAIRDLRQRGVEVTETVEDLVLTYCGDTGPGVFDLEPRVYATPVLIIECTFVRGDLRDKGRRFGHLHIEDLAERADRFENETIVLHHLSRRHGVSELRAAVEEKLPMLAERVRYIPFTDDGDETAEGAEP
jgi:ribonuclease Z